jgi:hypothetical protein
VTHPKRTLDAMAACAVFLAASCGYSASPALLPSHIKSVAIPVFENETTEYTLENELTDAVIQAFVEDNHLRVVDERSADAIIRGKVVNYRNSVFGFTTQAGSQEYRVTIGVSVLFKDLVKNREIWNEPSLVKTANYYVQDVPGQTAKTELDGRKEAIDKLADEILTRTVQSW